MGLANAFGQKRPEFYCCAGARNALSVRRMNQQELRERTKQFAIQIVRLCRALPQDWDIREMGTQLLRSGTSVAANYRACGRAHRHPHGLSPNREVKHAEKERENKKKRAATAAR